MLMCIILIPITVQSKGFIVGGLYLACGETDAFSEGCILVTDIIAMQASIILSSEYCSIILVCCFLIRDH